jgi:hypothetical protein
LPVARYTEDALRQRLLGHGTHGAARTRTPHTASWIGSGTSCVAGAVNQPESRSRMAPAPRYKAR